MEYMVLFFTHSGAIKFQRNCKKLDISCELMPVPRDLSSNCSISAKVNIEKAIENLIDDEVEKVFLIENNNNTLIYESD
ncbi:MAG TPA: DUF3343 domain-containing protein [Tissierellaceae bacterium]|nr:DUF3343 domain-containing protein [Tissierellaceae bacterium]